VPAWLAVVKKTSKGNRNGVNPNFMDAAVLASAADATLASVYQSRCFGRVSIGDSSLVSFFCDRGRGHHLKVSAQINS